MENKAMLRNNTTATRTDLSGDAVEEISSNLRRLLAGGRQILPQSKASPDKARISRRIGIGFT